MSTPFKFPTTLKEGLQLIGKLNQLEDTSEWSALLEKKVKVYVPTYAYNEKLKDTVNIIVNLNGTIHIQDYGAYSNFKEENLPVQSIVDALAVTIPQVLSTLLFLHFQLSETYKTLGGNWKDQKLDSNEENSQLKKWFTDNEGLSKDLMKRGFTSDELKDKKINGSEIMTKLKECLDSSDTFCILAAEVGLFFVASTWDDSFLANAILLLQAFCDEIITKKLSEHFTKHYYEADFEKFYDICESVSENLEFLTTVLHALSERGATLYQERLSYQSPYVFISWIDNNMQHVIRSLKNMGTDSLRWNKDNFNNATSAGPFKYEFMFKGNKWDEIDRQSLQLAIHSLTSPAASEYEAESLHDLLSFANRVHAPKVTTSGAVTGLVSTASLIGAATYALNIIGMADTAKSFIEFPDIVGELVTPAFDHAKQMLTKGV